MVGGLAAWYHGENGRLMVGLRNGGKTVLVEYNATEVIPEVAVFEDWSAATAWTHTEDWHGGELLGESRDVTALAEQLAAASAPTGACPTP